MLHYCNIKRGKANNDVALLNIERENTSNDVALLQHRIGKTNDDIKNIIETLPYMFPYMLQDKMRLSASYIKGEEGMKEAKISKISSVRNFSLLVIK